MSLAVNRLAERVDHAAEHALAHLHGGNAVQSLDGGALLELAGRLEQHRTHIVLLEVQRDATDTVLEFDELTSLHVGQAIDAGDAVPHLEDGANLLEVGFGLVAGQLLTQDGGYFGGFDLGHEVWDTLSKPVRRGCW